MSISEQVKELKELANSYYGEIKNHVSTIEKAADTIESLSEKLQAANMERSADFEAILEEIKERIFIVEVAEFETESVALFDDIEEIMRFHITEKSAEDCGGWIPCKEKLPEETGFYMVTKKIKETGERFSGKSRFDIEKGWNDPLNFVDIVAWQSLPEPYHEH